MRIVLHCGICSLFLLVTSASMSGTATSTMSVSFRVLAVCRVTADTLSFPSVMLQDKSKKATINGTTTFNIHCTYKEKACILPSKGTYTTHANINANEHAYKSTRTLKSASNSINYDLYIDEGSKSVWDDSKYISYTSNGKPTTFKIFGKAYVDKDAKAGVYTDQVILTPGCNNGRMHPGVLSVSLVVSK